MTFLDSAGDGVLKTDTVGRVRVSRERREQLLGEFATSSNSARRFAQLAGVNPVAFYSWVQKQRASGTGAPVRSAGSPVSFMEAVFASASAVSSGSEAPLVVHLGGGAPFVELGQEMGKRKGPFFSSGQVYGKRYTKRLWRG